MRHTQRRSSCEDGARTGVMQPQVKDHLAPPGPEKAGIKSPLEPSEEV